MMLGRSQIRNLINEAIYGKTAIVYHGSRTPPDELIKSFNAGGFQPGAGAGGLYGMGLYTVYDDKDLFVSHTGKGDYGPHVYKFKTNLNNFLALNEDTCKLVHGQILTVRQQLEKIKGTKIQIRDIENSNMSQLLDRPLSPKDELTGPIAKELSVYLMNDLVGMLFRGGNDGYVCLIFDDANTFPIAYASVEEVQAAGTIKNVNWEKIDKADIKNVLKRSATTRARPGKFIDKNLRDRTTGAYGMSELESSNVDVFLKRYEGVRKYIKINPDNITEQGYNAAKQKVLSGLQSVDNIREDQYKTYALEYVFFEEAISSASTLQGVVNIVEFDDLFDDFILGQHFGSMGSLSNKVTHKIGDIINAKYKDTDVQRLSNVLPELRITSNFMEKSNALYKATGSFNIVEIITRLLMDIIRYKKSDVDIVVFSNNTISLLKNLGSIGAIRSLTNELRDMIYTHSKKAGETAAKQINSGVNAEKAVINAVKNNKFLSVMVRHMRKASEDLNQIVIDFATNSYGMSGVTQSGEYVMLLVLQEAFSRVDKTKAREAMESIGYFVNQKLIPSRSASDIANILQAKLKS